MILADELNSSTNYETIATNFRDLLRPSSPGSSTSSQLNTEKRNL